MEYNVHFDLVLIGKKGGLQGASGEIYVTADASSEELKDSEVLIGMIANEMQAKTKKNILSVEITDVIEVKNQSSTINV
jgi:hypothetical protein